MDPLSITASVIAVFQLTGVVIGYLHDVKDAPKECRNCIKEVLNLQSLLSSLQFRLDDATSNDPWYTAVQALNDENGPLEQYKQALEQLRAKVTIQDGLQKIKRRVVWNFSKAEVKHIFERMERLKSLVSIALEQDHLYVQRPRLDVY
jgi:hypothetical protein